jgi:hypothetical protein
MGSCGCGRSPNGECNGWHGLTEAEYQKRRAEWEMEQYRKQVEDNWYHQGGGLK